MHGTPDMTEDNIKAGTTESSPLVSRTFRLDRKAINELGAFVGDGRVSEEIRALIELRLRALRADTPLLVGADVLRMTVDVEKRFAPTPAVPGLFSPASALVRDVLTDLRERIRERDSVPLPDRTPNAPLRERDALGEKRRAESASRRAKRALAGAKGARHA